MGFFVNFDCCENFNIAEQILKSICRITESLSVPTTIRILGLETITRIFQAVSNWYVQYMDLPRSTGDEIEEKDLWRRIKQNEGVDLFNRNPKKGLQYLIDNDLVPNHSKSIANFLTHQIVVEPQALTKLWSYGDLKERYRSIIFDIIDGTTFRGLSLFHAIEKLFSIIQIPAEGSVIDRMLEKFSETYSLQNKDTKFALPFQSFDATYLLSYHLIMLHTSLHSSFNYVKKLSKEDWVVNNIGLNEGNDFSYDFLSDLYDIVQKSRDSFRVKKDFYVQEYAWRQVKPWHAQLMFKKCWVYLLGSCSTDMHLPNAYAIFLEALQCGFRLSSFFQLEVEQRAFENSIQVLEVLSQCKK